MDRVRKVILRRCFSFLLCVVFVFSVCLYRPPKAESMFVVDDLAIGAAVILAGLGAIGITLAVQNMDKEAMAGAVQQMVNDFSDWVDGSSARQEQYGDSRDILNNVFNPGTGGNGPPWLIQTGSILLTGRLVLAIKDFAEWLRSRGEENTENPGEVFFEEGQIVHLPLEPDKLYAGTRTNGEDIFISHNSNKSSGLNKYGAAMLRVDSGYYLVFYIFENCVNYEFCVSHYIYRNGQSVMWYGANPSTMKTGKYYLDNEMGCLFTTINDGFIVVDSVDELAEAFSDVALPLSINVTIPEELSEIESEGVMEIPVEVPGTDPETGATAEEVAETVLESVAANQPVVTPQTVTWTDADPGTDPDPATDPELPDVDDLGLPTLGEAISTRFPFCIPWDIARAFNLLVYPAEPPRFEIDFLSVLDDTVHWQGSTEIVVDFSEYELLGKISRWTTTIGFCLILAVSSRKLTGG